MRTCTVNGCQKPHKTKGLCAMHAGRLRRHGHTDPTRISGQVEDFYTPGPAAECWLWRGSFNTYGYGRYGSPSKMAHRLVYETMRGEIPHGLVLDHLCRTPACVNPSHLEPVRQGVNIERGLDGYALRDKCRKGLHDISEPESWYINARGSRTCLECKRENDRRAEAKRKPRSRR